MRNHSDDPREQAKRAVKNRILQALRELGVSTVVIRYTGSGDSGCIDDVDVFGPADATAGESGQSMHNLAESVAQKTILAERHYSTFDHETGQWKDEVKLSECSLKSALEDLCYHLLGEHFPGWELNEGSDGTLELDVSTGEISLEHNENIMTQNTEYVRGVL